MSDGNIINSVVVVFIVGFFKGVLEMSKRERMVLIECIAEIIRRKEAYNNEEELAEMIVRQGPEVVIGKLKQYLRRFEDDPEFTKIAREYRAKISTIRSSQNQIEARIACSQRRNTNKKSA